MTFLQAIRHATESQLSPKERVAWIKQVKGMQLLASVLFFGLERKLEYRLNQSCFACYFLKLAGSVIERMKV